jgi:hypothetical protein
MQSGAARMNEPQPPINARRRGEWIEVTIASGLPGQAGKPGADGQPGPGAIISDIEPPPPTVDGVLWVNTLDGTVPTAVGFTHDEPITYADPPVTTQRGSGQPIGLSPDGTTFHQPDIVGGIPIEVNGRRYMIPIIEE